jgi:hypothetical protein
MNPSYRKYISSLRCYVSTGLLLLAGACTGVAQEQQESPLLALRGELAVQGWSRSDSGRIYKGNELFVFIDGGADLFFEYGFRQVLAMDFQNRAGQLINLELYEMNDPGAAFGIYSVRSGEEGRRFDIGGGGRIYSYYAMFWTGRYYVSVAASDSTGECRTGIEAIARMTNQSLFTLEEKPAVVKLLPSENLLKQTYIRGYLAFSSLDVIDVEEVMPAIEGVAGTYPDHMLTLLRYDSVHEAQHRLDEINRRLRSHDRYGGFQSRGQIASVLNPKGQTICFGLGGCFLVLSISSDESVAFRSCSESMLSLEHQGTQALPH